MSGSRDPPVLCLGTWALLPGDTRDIHIQLPLGAPSPCLSPVSPPPLPLEGLFPLNATCLLLYTSGPAC